MVTAGAPPANRRVVTYARLCRRPARSDRAAHCAPVLPTALEAPSMRTQVPNPSKTPAAPATPSTDAPAASRRRLFAGLGAVGAAAAASTLLPGVVPAEPAPVALQSAPENGGGYQLTQHVQRYYQTAKV